MQFFSPKIISKITLLNQVALDSLKARSERTIVRQFVDAGVSVLGADYGYSFIVDRDTHVFKLVYKDASTPFISRKPRKRGTQATAFRSKKPLFITNVTGSSQVRDDARQHMRSVVVIPLTYRKASYGTMNLCFNTTHRFTDEEKTLCEYIGNSAAQAITIFRLLAEKKAALAHQEQFLALASHELKTPITSLKVFSQSLLRAAGRRNAPEREIEMFTFIDRQINKLSKLMNDILDFSGFESGLITITRKPVRMAELIEGLREKVASLYPKATLVSTIGPEVVVAGDFDRLEHVFLNLLMNAVKYSSEYAVVTVAAHLEGTHYRISVVDQGIGIPQAQRDRIFNPFFQVKTSTVGGLGLGLYVAKKLIAQHKGHIWVDSELTKGSTFNVTLPITLLAEPEQKAESEYAQH